MSLPHVLLGLLSESPATGYELERSLREEIAPVWRAEFSQIYPALARLRRAGFVVLRVLGPRRGPRRYRYRLTATGRRELKRWIAEPGLPRLRDEALARVAFLDVLAPAERRAALLLQERSIADEIHSLRAAPVPRGFRSLARRGTIEKLEAVRRWLHALAHETAAGIAAPPRPSKRK